MPAQGIPASQVANVIPGVLAAGGTGLDMLGLCLTTSTRPPIGAVLSFPDAQAVGNYFGLSSDEYAKAQVYFLGFQGSPIQGITPGAMLFSQYPWAAAVPPYVRGGDIAAELTLAQLQAIAPGDLTVVINGVSWTSSSINLASATSFSNAASIIQTALAANDSAFTGVLAPETGSFTGTIADDVMDITAVSSGVVVVGGAITGTGVAANTVVLNQITGTPGGVGTYTVSPGKQSVSSETLSETYAELTASSVTGVIEPGQALAGAGLAAGSVITAPISGTGGAGTYVVSPTQTVASEAMTAGAAVVTFDSVSGAFIITGGTPGTPGTINFPTGAIATSLLLTAATGAVDSQGAPLASPGSYMAALWNTFQNFVDFFTLFEPDQADALSFAQWTNSLATEIMYIPWDPSAANVNADPATILGAIQSAGYSGSALFYTPINDALDAAMLSGMVASIDFTQANGRTDLAFRSQSGIPAEVTNGTQAAQLKANNINFYGTYSTPSENFTWIYPGVVTGPFLFIDSYVNAIWLKNILQLAILQLYASVRSIPFNAAGYALIQEALGGGPATNTSNAGPIQQALTFGAIRAGVTLSASEAAALPSPAAATALQNQGWFLQIVPATPQVRQARGPLVINFWYTDGQSVQQIELNSTAVL